ncbi:MAG: aldo/keto reductase [Clostridia bacterium]
MKQYEPISGLRIPCVAMGCMRIAAMEKAALEKLVMTAVEGGINFFDHADIYGKGESETRFGEVLSANAALRNKILIQSKCGIRAGYYDSSYAHIMDSVEASLKRLRVECLDVLLIHRPDALAEPDEIASAFQHLHEAGKVRYFGVSNHNSMQIKGLQQALNQPLLFNQLQMSVMHTGMIDQGIHVNTDFAGAVDQDGAVLEYCKLHKMVVQAWSPLQYGFFEGVFVDNPKFPELNEVLAKMAQKYEISKTALAAAWLVRIPAMVQVVTGTTNALRMKEMIKGVNIVLERSDWYEIYRAAGNQLP